LMPNALRIRSEDVGCMVDDSRIADGMTSSSKNL
jgi:hypothetical protein